MPNKLVKCNSCGEEKEEKEFGYSLYYARICQDCQKKYNLCPDCGNRVDDKSVIACSGYHGIQVENIMVVGPQNRLDEILSVQRQFQLDNQLDPPICDLASAIMCEGGELWSISGGKWWKRYLTDTRVPRGRLVGDEENYLGRVEYQNKEKIKDESIDILHFLLATWLRLGMSANDIVDSYLKKMGVNIKRQNNGY